MNVIEMFEKIFLLSEKMKFSTEQKVFIVRVYYTTKSYKKVWKEFSAKYSEVLLILTIIVHGQVKISMNIASQLCIPKNRGVMVCPGKKLWGQFFSHQQLLGMCTRKLFNSLCPS